ncbi:MAG: glycosyltransferase [Chloroflexota bacterium]
MPRSRSDTDWLAELQDRIDLLEREASRSRASIREAAATRRELREELSLTRADLSALRARRSVRIATEAASVVRRAVRAARRLVRGPGRIDRSIRRSWQQRRLRVSPAEERMLVASLRQGLAPATVTRGPLVSIIILNRDGREHLERCLRAVGRTTYRDIEIIVVDNGSTDGSAELAQQLDLPFPVRVIRNQENRSFSDANGQGVAATSGPLICLLNNDVDPITEDWLGYMVETLTSMDAAAVGARLIYPRHRGGRRAGKEFADLSLQHDGVTFDRTQAVPIPRVMGAGEGPLSAAAVTVVERPALTAACLLISRRWFDAVDGFTPDYDYGLEDIDLCLKLRAAGGRLLYDGRAALWHHESATRAADHESYKARVTNNREVYIDTWGPRIFRDALLDGLAGGDRFSGEPFHVAITVPSLDPDAGAGDRHPGHELGAALEGLGWRVSYLARQNDGWFAPDPSVEAIVVSDDACDIRRLPRNLVTMALIDDDPEPWLDHAWFDEFDLVFAASNGNVGMVRQRSAKVARLIPMATGEAHPEGADPYRPSAMAIRDALVEWASATRYGLRIGVPRWDDIDHWGDYHFARGLQRSFERAGHPTRVHFLPDWASHAAARDDIAVHLFGLNEAPTHRGQVNILWQISHPDLATPEIYERYDHVFVASDRFAARMARQVTVPVTSLHQATDPERFRPEPGGLHHELLFVAGSRKVRRRIVDDLAGTSYDLAIYGRHWTPDLVDPRFVRGEVIPNTDLARYYSAADIVLNDHWDDMQSQGFISNRPYDALACGAFVISDKVDGIEAEFDGAVPTYRSRAELEPLLARYLDDPAERQRLAAHGRAIVLARDTFDHRVQTLCGVAEPLARARSATIDAFTVAS